MDRNRFPLPHRPPVTDPPKVAPFLSVSATARLLGMSEMTLYRAIAAGEFPAVRIRGRLIIPTRAIDAMVDAALSEGQLVDAADWVSDDVRSGGAASVGDRGSAPVLPLVGFAAFLTLGSLLMRHPSMPGLVVVAALVLSCLVVVTLRTARREARANARFAAAFRVSHAEQFVGHRYEAMLDQEAGGRRDG